MPYKSEAQRRFFNSPAGKEKLGEEEVEHWNEVSKGMKLPEKAIDKAIRILDEQKISKEEYEAALSMIRRPVHKTTENQIKAAQEIIRKYKEQQAKIKAIDASFNVGKKYWDPVRHSMLVFIEKSDRSGVYVFEDFGDKTFYMKEQETNRLVPYEQFKKTEEYKKRFG